jgi:hypothetical protein
MENTSANDMSLRFQSFINKYEKKYSTEAEYAKRFEIYSANMAKMAAHNANPNASWIQGENKFTDLTKEEFKASYLGRNG